MRSERRRIWDGLLFAALFTILASISIGGVSAATTHYVNPGESIQNAVDVAEPGDTIIVRDGTYTEHVEVNVSNLTLRSENGSASTTVVAVVNTSAIFRVRANSVTISGFTVQNATNAIGLFLDSVHHCTISGNNLSTNAVGIYLDSSTNNNITGNTAYNIRHTTAVDMALRYGRQATIIYPEMRPVATTGPASFLHYRTTIPLVITGYITTQIME